MVAWNGHDQIAVVVQMYLMLRLDDDSRQILGDDSRASQTSAEWQRSVLIDGTLDEAPGVGEIHRPRRGAGQWQARRGWQGLQGKGPRRTTGRDAQVDEFHRRS